MMFIVSCTFLHFLSREIFSTTSLRHNIVKKKKNHLTCLRNPKEAEALGADQHVLLEFTGSWYEGEREDHLSALTNFVLFCESDHKASSRLSARLAVGGSRRAGRRSAFLQSHYWQRPCKPRKWISRFSPLQMAF